MSTLPRVRWLALLLAVAFGLVFAGFNFDLAAALGDLGTKAAAISTGLLAIAKIIHEAMRSIDATDPMTYTTDRSLTAQPFWRRVL